MRQYYAPVHAMQTGFDGESSSLVLHSAAAVELLAGGDQLQRILNRLHLLSEAEAACTAGEGSLLWLANSLSNICGRQYTTTYLLLFMCVGSAILRKIVKTRGSSVAGCSLPPVSQGYFVFPYGCLLTLQFMKLGGLVPDPLRIRTAVA